MIKLVPNAKTIALKSYSMWANYLGLICLALPEALWYFWGTDTNPRIWWLSGAALILFGTVGRLIVQPPIRSWKRMLLLSLLLLGLLAFWARPVVAGVPTVAEFQREAVPLVAVWEGKRNKAYLDRLASPPVWTVCYGETRGVGPNDYYTDEECLAMLTEGVMQFRVALHKYFTPTTLSHRLTPKRDAAYVSLAYNAGVYAIGRSTAVRRLNAGDIKGGCVAIGWWNKAGGRVRRGLVNRRAVDVGYCMEGLT